MLAPYKTTYQKSPCLDSKLALLRILVECYWCFPQLKVSLFPGVSHAPDAARTVICNVESAIVTYGYSYRSTPHLSIWGDKSGEKILVLAGGFAVLHGNPDDLVAYAMQTVPGSMFGCESVA